MKDLRIIFMGTPEFAVESLKAILAANYNVVAVITAPDRPAGRGQKLRKSAVKHYAEANELPVLQPTNLKDEVFLEKLRAYKANLQVVVAFRMLPAIVWQMPELGTFNLHASLLPDYRGAAPINWAIINGERQTGITTFFIDEKIDTGAILMQETLPIEDTENAGELHDKLMIAGGKLVVESLKLIEQGTYKLVSQSQSLQKNTAYKLDRANTQIDWNDSTPNIYNKIRGLSPYPTAWTQMSNNGKSIQMKIYAARQANHSEIEQKPPGSITVNGDTLYIATSDGSIAVTELQLAGKRKMMTKELLNGYTFSSDARMQ